MLNDQVFYHGHVRNVIIAFGSLFSSIRFERKNATGVVEQTIHVPIAYAQKEKWIQSNETNPDSERGIYTAIPRIGFEITGYSYDATRKLARMNQVYCTDDLGRKQVFTPVPYNIDISLFFVTKTQEDALQILEQILPTFSPEYTMSVSAIPALNLVQDVPFILNSVSVQDDYEGDLETRRFVIHTLNFTAKVNFFGGMSNVGVIKQVEANVATNNLETTDKEYIASQSTLTAPIIEAWFNKF